MFKLEGTEIKSKIKRLSLSIVGDTKGKMMKNYMNLRKQIFKKKIDIYDNLEAKYKAHKRHLRMEINMFKDPKYKFIKKKKGRKIINFDKLIAKENK